MFSLCCIENDHQTGEFLFEAHKLQARIASEPVTVCINSDHDRKRFEVERFIKSTHPTSAVGCPILISMHDKGGRIIAAAGLRPAMQEPLSLEQDIKSSVETILQAPRRQVVEISNMALGGHGEDAAFTYLFAVITAYLSHQGFTRAVINGPSTLQNQFKHLGLPLQLLAKTESAQKSFVLTTPLADAYRHFKTQLGLHYIYDHPTTLAQFHRSNSAAEYTHPLFV